MLKGRIPGSDLHRFHLLASHQTAGHGRNQRRRAARQHRRKGANGQLGQPRRGHQAASRSRTVRNSIFLS